ncbi:hypothetical protein EMIT0324P_11637 [Pseudomonas chlororaphis]
MAAPGPGRLAHAPPDRPGQGPGLQADVLPGLPGQPPHARTVGDPGFQSRHRPGRCDPGPLPPGAISQPQPAAPPHCAQNRAPAARVLPHWRHAAGCSEVPHCWQKRALAALFAPQSGHSGPPAGGTVPPARWPCPLPCLSL